MSEEGKKISFGFSKFVKKTQIIPSQLNKSKPQVNNIELIDCFEGKTIKLKDPIISEEKVLVIPLKRQQDTNANDRPKSLNNKLQPSFNSNSDIGSCETLEQPDKLVSSLDNSKENQLTPVSAECLKPVQLTLDEIAAKEIIEDLQQKKTQEDNLVFTVPLTNNPPAGEKESSLEDYEKIPVNNFGMAMLRGMGWAPGKGVGKNGQLITPSTPTLRPKGMGLGADKVINIEGDGCMSSEKLKMVKNSFVRIKAGPNKGLYGQIEGFDDEGGRLIVKLALKNTILSLNEFMVQLVDKTEFTKNSKVINVTKFEQYKKEDSKKGFNTFETDQKDIGLERHSNLYNRHNDLDHLSRKSKPTEFKVGLSKCHSQSSKNTTSSSKNSDKANTVSKKERLRRSSSSEDQRHSHLSSKSLYSSNKTKQKLHKESKHSRRRSSSSISSDSNSESDKYSRKNKYYSKTNKSVLYRHKSRSRSRSPSKVDERKKHKKGQSKYR